MKHAQSPLRTVVLVVLLAMLLPAMASAQSEGGLADWIDRTNAHRISGYVTLGLATVTATLGLLDVPAHPILGISTAASASVTLGLGSIAYRDRLSRFWPHAVLTGVATAGFLTNVILLEGGSTAHVATGIASTATLFAGYGAILFLK
jgi:hypothetical protein